MWPMLAALAVTQVLGWSTTFYIPAVLGDVAHQATGLSPTVLFGGVTVMFLVGGLAAPFVGRQVDRLGGRPVMMLGSVLAGLSLLAMAFTRDAASWFAAWIGIGLMMPMALSSTCYAAVAQVALARGIPPRQPMGALALASGIAISVAFPLGAFASRTLGWQGSCLAYAAINLLVCLPLHATIPRGATGPRATAQATGPSRVPPAQAGRVMLLLAIAFTLHGLSSVALELHLMALLAAAGVGPALALGLAAFSGPCRVVARLLDIGLARRFSALVSGLGAMLLLPPSMVFLLAGGAVGASGFMLMWSMSIGIATVSRAALPLELFGPAGYAARLGRLTMPISLGQALAPMVAAALLESVGATLVGWIILALSLCALAALLAVVGIVRRSESG
jgi:predicted MFS family arabinose efflux permease